MKTLKIINNFCKETTGILNAFALALVVVFASMAFSPTDSGLQTGTLQIKDSAGSVYFISSNGKKMILQESSSSLTLGSVAGTGAGGLFVNGAYCYTLNVGSMVSGMETMNITGTSLFNGLAKIPEHYIKSHGTESTKPDAGDGIMYIKSGKLVIRYNNGGANAYFYGDLTTGGDITALTYSPTEP